MTGQELYEQGSALAAEFGLTVQLETWDQLSPATRQEWEEIALTLEAESRSE